MKTTIIVAAAAVACVAVSGCATKRYPIATEFSAAEARLMNCDQLALELVRSEQVRLQITETATTDWRSVAGFLGDYGIGNAMAKSEAEASLERRIAGIRNAQAEKNCSASGGGAMARLGAFIGGVLGR